MVEITWGQLVSPNTYLGALRNVNVPRATCFLLSTLSARKCGRSMPSKSSSSAGGGGGGEKEALIGSVFAMPAILFAKEFFVGSADSRRKALLGLASPVVAFIVRLRWTQKLTASEVVQLFAESSSSSSSSEKKKKGTTTNEKISLMGKIMVGDEVLVNAFSALVLAASVVPEDLREASFLPGGPVIRVFSEKYKFDVDAVQLPKLNMPKVGNFFVFDVYSEKNETLFGGRGQGFKYNLFLTPRYVTYDLPVYAYKQFKESKLAKAKCIVKSQKYGFEIDLIETFNPFTLPQRLFFRASKVVGKVGSVAIAKPAQMAQRQFVRTVLRREPREPRQLTFLERLQVMLGLIDPEEIANEPESPRSSLLPFSKPETPSSRSASKNGSKRGSKANSKAASGRSTPFFGGGGYDEDNTSESNKNDKKNKNKKDGKKKDSDDKVSSSSVSKKNSNDNTAASSASDLTQLLPRLKSFSEIKEDVDSFFQGTPEEQAARKKTQEEAKKKLDQEQKKKQKELAQKRERELKEQKKKAQEEEKLREKAEAEGRRMVEVNDSYFNRYVPDVAETLPFKAPTAVEGPKK